MREYTPTTEGIKSSATEFNAKHSDEQFDRWLAGVQSDAWKEGYVAGFCKPWVAGWMVPIGRRAARSINEGERTMSDVSKTNELIAGARGALERINKNTFDHDLLFQYRGGVLRRELTLIVRDLADALEASEARIDRWMLLVGKCVEERMDAEAERDAALAAIERVKETLSLHNPNGRLVKEVLAALDGEWGNDEDYPTIVEKIVERRKDAVMQQRDKYEESIRSAERERIIAILESLKGTCSGDCDDCRPYAQINDNYLTQVIALITGETQ